MFQVKFESESSPFSDKDYTLEEVIDKFRIMSDSEIENFRKTNNDLLAQIISKKWAE